MSDQGLFPTGRDFLLAARAAAVSACSGGDVGGGPSGAAASAPSLTFIDPGFQLSGELRITLVSHCVLAYDQWFGPFARRRGELVAADVFFVPALRGAEAALAAQRVMSNWIVSSHTREVDAAKEFHPHYMARSASATYHSRLYDQPDFSTLLRQANGWLQNHPFDALPANKQAALTEGIDWSSNIGYPGAANTAVGEGFRDLRHPELVREGSARRTEPQRQPSSAPRSEAHPCSRTQQSLDAMH
jgi:hypothetical protein